MVWPVQYESMAIYPTAWTPKISHFMSHIIQASYFVWNLKCCYLTSLHLFVLMFIFKWKFAMQMCSPVANMLSLKVRGLLEHPPTHSQTPIGEKVLVLQQSIHMRPFLNGGKHGSKGGWGRRGRGLYKMNQILLNFPKSTARIGF